MKQANRSKFLHAVRGIGTWFGGAMRALIAIAAFALAGAAWAATWTDGNGYTWTYSVEGGKVKIESGAKKAAIDPKPTGDFEIPSTINGTAVGKIGQYAFYGCDGLTSVKIPSGVTSIQTYAFQNCSSLINVDIPDGVTGLGAQAFMNCTSLEMIRLPEGVDRLLGSVFNGCTSLKSVSLPHSLTVINEAAFKNCSSLEYLVIPDSVTTINPPYNSTMGAFVGCTSLKSVKMPKDLFTTDAKAKYFPNSPEGLEIASAAKVGTLTWNFRVVDGGAVLCWDDDADVPTIPVDTKSDVIIPDNILGYPVVGIGDNAFDGCEKMESVSIPATVTSIGDAAFSECECLESVIFRGTSTLASIGEDAFYGCGNLVNLTIPASLKAIGDEAFCDCHYLPWDGVPDTVESIGDGAFFGCDAMADEDGFVIVRGVLHYYNNKHKAAVIPDGVTRIGVHAFSDCTIYGVSIPATVTSIGRMAFANCANLKDVDIPASVTDIEGGAFWMCDAMADEDGFVIVRDVLYWYDGDATAVTVPGGVTAVSMLAFYDNDDVKRVTLPASVTTIGVSAFESCGALTEVTIPSGVTTIEAFAFIDDTYMMSVLLKKVHVESGDTARVRQLFMNSGHNVSGIVFREDVAEPCEVKFDANGGSVSPATRLVTKGTAIGVLPKPEYEGFVFGGWFTALDGGEEITSATVVNAAVTYYARWTDENGCAQWTDENGVVWRYRIVDDGAEVYNNGDAAIPTATSGSIAVPAALGEKPVTRIGDFAFRDCGKLTSVSFPETVKSIGAKAFASCASLVVATITSSVTSIGEEAFVGTGLSTVCVDAGDAARVRQMFVDSKHDVSKITFLEGAELAAKWFTTKAEAVAVALKTGKKIFLVCGRDTCYNTMTTKNVSCEEPAVKAVLTAKCVLWYSNCDTQEAENDCYWPMGVSVTLPLVCVIDPKDPDHFIKRTTGGDHGGPLSGADVLAFIADIPYPPGTNSSASGGSGYAFLSPDDIKAPYAAGKTLYGAVYSGNDVVGVVELKLAKVNARRGTGRVSGSVTLLDGKRYTIRGVQALVSATAPLTVTLEVKKVSKMTITIGGDQFAGSFGSWHVQTANVGGNWKSSVVTASVTAGNLSAIPGTVLDILLPYAEKGTSTGIRWSFPKATKVKWAKPKYGEEPITLDAASGKGLIVDTSKSQTNLSSMKLTYTAKKGTFKGSFKVYALEGSGAATKLKKYTVKVGGVVVDGVGYGSATCKRPAIDWKLTVK